jgi:eukaryotic-like serine/threonine-protein kinase
VRYCVGCTLVAVTVAAGQAVAQPYYPPRVYYGQPPSAYYYYYGPAPGGYYPPPSYGTPPVPPVAVEAPAPDPSYGPGYPQAAPATPGYPLPSGPDYAPPDRAAGGWIAGLPPEDQPETNQSAELPPQFRR